jgi:Flp pilus assembly pilin Flp
MRFFKDFFKDEEGVVFIEYALIGALVGVALIVALIALADEINNVLQRIILALASA